MAAPDRSGAAAATRFSMRALEELPKRPAFAETGSVTLPRFVFDWPRESQDESWILADLGMLVAMLQVFENRICLFANGGFEDENGEPVLAVRGGPSDLRFVAGKNASSVDSTGSGHVREREALRTLARNGWLSTESSAEGLRITLEARAKKLREGKATDA